MPTNHLSLAVLFDDWRARNTTLDRAEGISDEEGLAASLGIWGLADAALSVPPMGELYLSGDAVLARTMERGLAISTYADFKGVPPLPQHRRRPLTAGPARPVGAAC